MAILSSFNHYVNVFIACLFIILSVGGGAVFYFLKIKKVRSKKENIDYSRFERKDALEYVKLDTIISGNRDGKHKDFGIVVKNNGRTFIAALEVNGFNFNSASADEQLSAMKSYIGFLNTIEEPIQYRQSTKAVDLSERIAVHEKLLKNTALKLMELDADYKDLLAIAEQYMEQPEVYDSYYKELQKLQREMISNDWKRKELEIEIEYMNSISGQGNDSSRVESYIVSWTYSPDEYTEELDTEGIYSKAVHELSIKLHSLSQALARCNCRSRVLSPLEIMDLFKHHYHPSTADDAETKELLDSEYNALCISSDSLVELEIERLGDEEYERQMEMYRQREEDALAHQEILMDEFENELNAQVSAEAALMNGHITEEEL